MPTHRKGEKKGGRRIFYTTLEDGIFIARLLFLSLFINMYLIETPKEMNAFFSGPLREVHKHGTSVMFQLNNQFTVNQPKTFKRKLVQ